MRLNVPPTKSNSLAISRELGFAVEGYDLLEQKRQILMLELMQHIEGAKRDQADADKITPLPFPSPSPSRSRSTG